MEENKWLKALKIIVECINAAADFQDNAAVAYNNIIESITKTGFPKGDIYTLLNVKDVSRIYEGIDALVGVKK